LRENTAEANRLKAEKDKHRAQLNMVKKDNQARLKDRVLKDGQANLLKFGSTKMSLPPPPAKVFLFLTTFVGVRDFIFLCLQAQGGG